jgi:Zn ribbon nucleic-acid-binding protein
MDEQDVLMTWTRKRVTVVECPRCGFLDSPDGEVKCTGRCWKCGCEYTGGVN